MPDAKVLPALVAFAAFLVECLPRAADEAAVPLWFRVPVEATEKMVHRVAFALDSRALGDRSGGEWDALFLHRPFDLPATLRPDLPLFAAHRAFDTRYAFGYNPALAERLGMTDLVPLYRLRPHRPDERIGMVGNLTAPRESNAFLAFLATEFGGIETDLRAEAAGPIPRIAVVGAMTPELIAQAADEGAQVYVTGQFRENSRRAAERTAISVVAVGHRRSEGWGLRQLAQDCARAFPGLRLDVLE